jgi:hypothetical protein
MIYTCAHLGGIHSSRTQKIHYRSPDAARWLCKKTLNPAPLASWGAATNFVFPPIALALIVIATMACLRIPFFLVRARR